jgi:hypothetical protein
MGKSSCQVWSNDSDFLQVQKNGRPNFQVISFKLVENKVKFTKVSEISPEKLEESLVGFKLVDKVLTLG